MRCALAYPCILARDRAPYFQRGHRQVSRGSMCPKEVVERCVAAPLISVIERVCTPRGIELCHIQQQERVEYINVSG
jgi:hypothetical protein